MGLPDLSTFRIHRLVTDVDLDGVAFPELTATFHRRTAGSRVETVGVYRCTGVALFMAWGYVGEEHCRWHSYREVGQRAAGAHGWGAPRRGCPSVDAVRRLIATLDRVPTSR